MAIVKDLTITVNGNQSKLSKDVYLYLGDGGITLLITVLEDSFRFGTFKSDGSNIVEDSNTVFVSKHNTGFLQAFCAFFIFFSPDIICCFIGS